MTITAAAISASGMVDSYSSADEQIVGHYRVGPILGNGTFSIVRRGVHAISQVPVALKIISKNTGGSTGGEGNAEESNNAQLIGKEVLIHRNLNHINITRLFETFEDASAVYLVQELVVGGELFEKIEPDVGFCEEVAQFYFRQLLAAVEYLHAQGVAHRDLKPENMLLNEAGNLKITDFGLATVFRRHNQRRTLQTRCGTTIYMAPEIITGEYQGDAVDLWSCAVILFVMLVGNVPWEEPSARCEEYVRFVRSKTHPYHPWSSIAPSVKDLLLRMLRHNPTERLTMEQVKQHPWVKQPNILLGGDGMCSDSKLLARMITSKLNVITEPDDLVMSLSQPEAMSYFASQTALHYRIDGFSQPVRPKDIDASSLTPPTPKNTINCSQPTDPLFANVARLTRFFSRKPFALIHERICKILTDFLVPYKSAEFSNRIVFATVDKRKNPLTGEVNIVSVRQDVCLVLFTKSKGDAIEFKRFFKIFIAHLGEGMIVH